MRLAADQWAALWPPETPSEVRPAGLRRRVTGRACPRQVGSKVSLDWELALPPRGLVKNKTRTIFWAPALAMCAKGLDPIP